MGWLLVARVVGQLSEPVRAVPIVAREMLVRHLLELRSSDHLPVGFEFFGVDLEAFNARHLRSPTDFLLRQEVTLGVGGKGMHLVQLQKMVFFSPCGVLGDGAHAVGTSEDQLLLGLNRHLP